MDKNNPKIESLREEIQSLKDRMDIERKENAILLKLGSLLESNLRESEDKITEGVERMIAQMQTQTSFVQNNQKLILEKTDKIEISKNETEKLAHEIINCFGEYQKKQLILEQKMKKNHFLMNI